MICSAYGSSPRAEGKMNRWTPRIELTKREALILRRVEKRRKLFAFLRLHRHELFDDEFQEELESMYRDTGAGSDPTPPAFMCMVLLLQGYFGLSDGDAVDAALLDARWQMVLDCIGEEEPIFSQGALQQFRERLIAADMDRRLLERTIELAKKTAEFDWKKLPKDLRVGVDSRPLEGAGRVEDTFNLLGHAGRKIVDCAAKLLDRTREDICRQAGAPLFAATSVKAALDINWNRPEDRDDALEILFAQITSLHEWLEHAHLLLEEPLKPYIDAIAQVCDQDLEVGADGSARIRRGVAEDRRVSIEDPEMRHGRKSKTKRFNGYKEHIAADLDSGLIRACATTRANRPEEEATPALANDIRRQGAEIQALFIDRAYVNSSMVHDVIEAGGEIICKPWQQRNARAGLFSKEAFKINVRDKTITCPAGQVETFEPGDVVEFDAEICGACPLRAECTYSASGRGRTVHISKDERLQKRLRKLQTTTDGRERLRMRTGVEHRLAHISARKGPRARYKGVRKNLYDLRRAAAIQNMETIQRKKYGSLKIAK